eukprot:16437006-Heterocapsa_arctica.AAC.1
MRNQKKKKEWRTKRRTATRRPPFAPAQRVRHYRRVFPPLPSAIARRTRLVCLVFPWVPSLYIGVFRLLRT